MTLFLVSLAGGLVLTGVTIPALKRAQFIDVPNHRSSHSHPVPRGGGLAVVVCRAILAPAALGMTREVAVIVAATVLLASVGLVDDLRSLPSGVRLLAQGGTAAAAAAALISGGSASWWWLPVLVVAVAGYVNAFNFMDGVNGISALTGVAVGLWWAWAGDRQDHLTLSTLGLVLAGTCLGFLPWNAPVARVFLGDVGSYGVGVFVALLSTVAVVDGLPLLWALAPLAVYGADTGWVIVKRLRAGSRLTQAHREHVYQRLVDGGWPHLAAAALCATATASVCAAAGLAVDGSWWGPASVAAVIVLAYLGSARVLVGRST